MNHGHWTISGALRFHTRPYFDEELSTQGYGMKGDLQQLNLGNIAAIEFVTTLPRSCPPPTDRRS